MEKVLLADVRDGARWQLLLGPKGEGTPDLAFLRAPDGSETTFSRKQMGTSCDFTTRDDECTVILPTPGRVRTFSCSVAALQPLLYWLRADLAPFENARVGRELLFAIPLGIMWILAGAPIISQGIAHVLIGLGVALLALGIVGQIRPHRYLLLVDAALWFAIAAQNARVAYAGSGVLAVVMTLFAASFGFRVIKLFAFHRALARP